MQGLNTVVILGGVRPHAVLADYLRQKGYQTVLIDYLPHPFAKDHVDIHYQESTLDAAVVEQICRKENARYIMDLCTDRAIPVGAYVAERLGIDHPYSYETSLIVTNKNKMKAWLKSIGIPTSDFRMVLSMEDIQDEGLRYPLVVKPSDASGSIGITKVGNSQELKDAVDKALSLSRNQQAIVEEFVQGPEIQIDCFVADGEAVVLDIKEKRKYTGDILTLSYGSLIPARISDEMKQRCHTISNRIATALGIENGPLYIQAIVTDSDVSVIEFGIRFGGNLSFRIVQDMTGVDIITTSADAFLGLKPELRIQQPSLPVYATYHVFPRKGVFSALVGFDELKADGSIDTLYANRPTGMMCSGDMSSSERIVSFTVRAGSYREVDEKMRHILQMMDVLDERGESIMRKDIYELV